MKNCERRNLYVHTISTEMVWERGGFCFQRSFYYVRYWRAYRPALLQRTRRPCSTFRAYIYLYVKETSSNENKTVLWMRSGSVPAIFSGNRGTRSAASRKSGSGGAQCRNARGQVVLCVSYLVILRVRRLISPRYIFDV